MCVIHESDGSVWGMTWQSRDRACIHTQMRTLAQVLLEVNDRSLENMDLMEVHDLIEGNEGTRVLLKLSRSS